VTPQSRDVDTCGEFRLVGRGGQGVGEPPVEQRRVDAPGEPAYVVERFAEMTADLFELCPGSCRIGLEEVARKLQVDAERDQVLLRTVVQRALDPAPLGVGGRNDACS
jgi:hypothetical protein